MNTITGLLRDYSKCDSPIEDIFYDEIQKLIVPEAQIIRQAVCKTGIGTFRLDFLVKVGKRKIGFECDGKAFHEETRDSERDKAIIESGHADRIYRIRGFDIVYHFHDAMDLISVTEKDLFSQRGKDIIKALCSRSQNHEDTTLISDLEGFPGSATRYYNKSEEEDCEYEDFGPKPTHISWT